MSFSSAAAGSERVGEMRLAPVPTGALRQREGGETQRLDFEFQSSSQTGSQYVE